MTDDTKLTYEELSLKYVETLIELGKARVHIKVLTTALVEVTSDFIELAKPSTGAGK